MNLRRLNNLVYFSGLQEALRRQVFELSGEPGCQGSHAPLPNRALPFARATFRATAAPLHQVDARAHVRPFVDRQGEALHRFYSFSPSDLAQNVFCQKLRLPDILDKLKGFDSFILEPFILKHLLNCVTSACRLPLRTSRQP